MTAWARGGQAAASPSRLARSAPPLRGCGLDRLPPARRGLAMRSRLEVRGAALFFTVLPGEERTSPDRHGLFAWKSPCAMLAGCLDHAVPLASCPTTFMSCPVPGRASAGQSSTTLKRGASWTIGPRACRSQTPRSTYSRLGSVIFSTNCSGRADDLRRRLP